MTRGRFVLAGAAILVLATALRLPGLDDQSLWSDEIYTVESARWPLPVLLAVRDGHPPLFGLIVKALDHLRPSDLHGRVVAAAAGVAAVGAMLGLGGAIAGRGTALVAASLLAASPLHVWYSREGRMYSLVVLCSIAGSWLLVRAVRDGARGAWAGWGLASVLGLATHYLYGAVLLAQALFLGLRRGAPAALAAGGVGLVLLGIGLALVGGEAAGVVVRRRDFEWLALPYTGFTFVGGFGLGPPLETLQRDRALATIAAFWPGLTVVAITGATLAWAAVRALPGLGVWGAYLALWLLVPAVTVFAGAWLTGGAYSPRYLLAALPAFVLLAAIGIAGLPRRWGATCFAVLVALSALSITRDRFDPRYARDDLRGAARWLRTHAGGEEPVAVSAAYVVAGLRHYEPGLRLAPLPTRPLRNAAQAEAAAAELLAAGGWLVLSREWEDDPAGHLERAITARAPHALVARLPGVRIFRLHPGG